MHRVTIVDPATGQVVTTLPAPNVYELGFSPLGTFIITWQRPSKDEAGDAVKNLRVWRVLDETAGQEGERDTVGRFVQKSQTGWNLQYTSDERFCARAVTNQIQIYQSDDLSTVWNNLRVEGVTDFAVAPGETHSIAVFVPERKVDPAVYGHQTRELTICRVIPQLLKFSRFHNSRRQYRKRPSLKEIRFN